MRGLIFGIALALAATTATADTLDEMMDRGDWQAAAKLAPELAAKGDARAAAYVSYLLQGGYGWVKDFAAAARWGEVSASAGDPLGAAMLGIALTEMGMDLQRAESPLADRALTYGYAWLTIAKAKLPTQAASETAATSLADAFDLRIRSIVERIMAWPAASMAARREAEAMARQWVSGAPLPPPSASGNGAADAWRESQKPTMDLSATRDLLDRLEAAVR